ncbi:hypothetical protein [Nocardia sp. NPDC050435]
MKKLLVATALTLAALSATTATAGAWPWDILSDDCKQRCEDLRYCCKR